MGLRSLFTGRSRAVTRAREVSAITVEAVVVEDDGNSVEVVGESHYKDALVAISGRTSMEEIRHPITAALVREPDNPYDDQAVAVWVESRKVGHLSRADARAYQAVLLELGSRNQVLACNARICAREGTPNLGVWLDLPEPDDVFDQIDS